MLLLFVAGAMNLAWMAVLSVVVLAEKVMPHGPWWSRMLGIGFIGWGLFELAPAFGL